ncbi:hypothetical protein BpHYR1_019596 [Brachionus plicatilis]|uniref:Uncharacterized protein n=1 Tax=Brachionus plicatilis TaxID=10195 RepID=A0A3M7SHM7_BRAPC|nr:hypothetical protein BpHYR1_019596 [Brachionus plicatilis]
MLYELILDLVIELNVGYFLNSILEPIVDIELVKRFQILRNVSPPKTTLFSLKILISASLILQGY